MEKSEDTVKLDLWEMIKNRSLEIYGLPNQTVEKHCAVDLKMSKIDRKKLYLQLKHASVLPALEEACKDFEFEITKLGVVATRKNGV
ncbi:MAG: hypothetical protein LC122_12710 [Chitinophagales bacterium]|nr:hypothetical protein [Chitinophagales bacterium]